jgi:putative transposase
MVNIPKLGRIRFRWTKDLPGVSRRCPAGRITGARLTKDALGWHIAFRAEWAVKDPPPQAWSESHVGIDRGIIVPIALSDGTSYDHRPWLTATEQACLLQAERQATHRRQYRKPGKQTSKRLHSVYDRIEGLRARAKRRALDWQHKTTTAIADQFTLVSVEQLAITNMLKSARGTLAAPGTNVSQKSGLNRRIAAEAWGRTVRLLDYKVTARGGALVRVPAPGTSLRCSVCNTITPGSRESQANFMCKNLACGWSGNADHNASRNIDRAGLELASAAGRAVVRQT